MRLLASFVLLCGALVASAPALASTATAEKVRLQAAMQQHIDSLTVDGAILYLDTAGGRVIELFPTQAHPLIMTMGEHFVLCADLKDASGTSIPIDLYMAADGERFVTFHTEIGNREPLRAMLARGQVKTLK